MTPREPATRKARWRKALLAGVGIGVAALGFLTWYGFHYSMNVTRSFEVTGSPSGPSVLIASQGSDFKDAVVAGLVEHLKRRSAYVKVIDVSALPGIQETRWDAMVVIHTWEMRKPPAAVRVFVDRVRNRDKLLVLTTSGAGDFKMEGVDAISTASKMVDVPARVAEMAKRVDAILDAE